MVLPTDGWLTAALEAWTYASATTFTVPSDLTAKYTVGTRLKLTQSATVKFFVVTAASFGAGNTTVTVNGGSDYSLANAAITLQSYSYEVNPQGYPRWFNYTLSWGGYGATPPTATGQFSVLGGVCTVTITRTAGGTSNATNLTVNIPITCAAVSSFVIVRGIDNGGSVGAEMQIAGTTATFVKPFAESNWTNTGTKWAEGTFSYAI